MKKPDTSAFVSQVVFHLLVLIGGCGGFGLGAVWLRHQISITANRNRVLEAGIAEVERHLNETVTDVEREQGPDALKRRDVEWHLGLVEPQEAQVQRVNEDAGLRLAAKHDAGLFADRAPMLTSFHLPDGR